jgi:hypothetical protein
MDACIPYSEAMQNRDIVVNQSGELATKRTLMKELESHYGKLQMKHKLLEDSELKY